MLCCVLCFVVLFCWAVLWRFDVLAYLVSCCLFSFGVCPGPGFCYCCLKGCLILSGLFCLVIVLFIMMFCVFCGWFILYFVCYVSVCCLVCNDWCCVYCVFNYLFVSDLCLNDGILIVLFDSCFSFHLFYLLLLERAWWLAFVVCCVLLFGVVWFEGFVFWWFCLVWYVGLGWVG